MFLLKFTHKETGKKYFLYQDGAFVGGNSYEKAEYASINRSARAVSVGGFDIVEVTIEKLAELIGTNLEKPEFKIIAFHGGLIPFEGVEIICGDVAEAEKPTNKADTFVDDDLPEEIM